MGKVELNSVKRDWFSGNTWFFGQVEFIRNAKDIVTGFKVSSNRARNVHFEKVEK